MFKPSSNFLTYRSKAKHFCYLCFVLVMLSCLFLAALLSPAGKGLTSWLSCVWCLMCSCVLSLSHQVWYLIVLISDLCLLPYFGYTRFWRRGSSFFHKIPMRGRNKYACVHNDDSDQTGHQPNLIRALARHTEKGSAYTRCFSLRPQQRLWLYWTRSIFAWCLVKFLFLAQRIRIFEILHWDRISSLTHAIYPGRQVMSSCEIAS